MNIVDRLQVALFLNQQVDVKEFPQEIKEDIEEFNRKLKENLDVVGISLLINQKMKNTI